MMKKLALLLFVCQLAGNTWADAVQLDASGFAHNEWTDEGEAYDSDESWASAPNKNLDSTWSFEDQGGDPGAITKVEISVEHHSTNSGNDRVEYSVQDDSNGMTLRGNFALNQTSDVVDTYDYTSVNGVWTWALVNSIEVKLETKAGGSWDADTEYVDQIYITVTYDTATPTFTHSYTHSYTFSETFTPTFTESHTPEDTHTFTESYTHSHTESYTESYTFSHTFTYSHTSASSPHLSPRNYWSKAPVTKLRPTARPVTFLDVLASTRMEH